MYYEKFWTKNKKILLNKLCFKILFLTVVVFSAESLHANVRINEINWKGVAGNSYAEWFELYNSGSSVVDLSGFTLYKNQGDTKIIELSGNIPAGGYFVVERTTPSSPDPLPGINNQNGSFGGGGFSNSGEYLILKDGDGVFADSVDFSSGWGVGDSYDQTAQWNGSWISGSPTPGQANASYVESSNSNTETEEQDKEIGVSENEEKPLDFSLEIKIDGALFVDSPIVFSPEISRSDGVEFKTGFVYWSLGDGTSLTTKSSDMISHVYKHPGTYVVIAEYRRKESFIHNFDASKKLIVNITNPNIILSSNEESGFLIENKSGKEIDMSGWTIKHGEGSFIFPRNTIILAGGTLNLPTMTIGFGYNRNYPAKLLFVNGQIASSLDIEKPEIKNYNITKTKITEDAVIKEEEVREDDTGIQPELLSAQVYNSLESSGLEEKSPLFLLGSIFISIVGFLSFVLFRKERKNIEKSAYDYSISEDDD